MDKTEHKRRSTITYYIDRLANGDASYKDKLCQRLADRLLYIPLQSHETSESSRQEVTIKVHHIMAPNGKEAVPVFSNRHLLEAWCGDQQIPSREISILGADLCKVLGQELWLVIDPCSEAELLLHPESVQRIAQFGDQAMLAEFGNSPETQIVEVPQELKPPVNAEDIKTSEPESEPISEEQPLNNTGLRDWLNISE